MNQVPMSGAFPDVFSSSPFKKEISGNFSLQYFKNILPMAARSTAESIMNYPMVLSVSEIKSKNIVYFVTYEQSMFGTSCLCAFNSDGMHINLGSLSPDFSDHEFVERSRQIASKNFSLNEFSSVDIKNSGGQKLVALLLIATLLLVYLIAN